MKLDNVHNCKWRKHLFSRSSSFYTVIPKHNCNTECPILNQHFSGGNIDVRRAFLIFVILSEQAGATNGAEKISALHYT